MHGDDSPLATFQAEVADDIARLDREFDKHRKADKERHRKENQRLNRLEERMNRAERLESEILELQNWRRIWSEMREAEGQH